MMNAWNLQYICLVFLVSKWSLFSPCGSLLSIPPAAPFEGPSSVQRFPHTDGMIVCAGNSWSHIVPGVKSIFSRIRNPLSLGKWFGKFGGHQISNVTPTTDVLTDTVEILTNQLKLKKEEEIILRHQLSRMKTSILLEKKEKIQVKQQFQDLLQAVDADHQERMEQMRKELGQQFASNHEKLLIELSQKQEEEKDQLKRNLYETFQEEKKILVTKLNETRDQFSQVLLTVNSLKDRIKYQEELHNATIAEYEKREGMYLKTIEELKGVIRRQQQKYQTTPLDNRRFNSSKAAAETRLDATRCKPSPKACNEREKHTDQKKSTLNAKSISTSNTTSRKLPRRTFSTTPRSVAPTSSKNNPSTRRQ